MGEGKCNNKSNIINLSNIQELNFSKKQSQSKTQIARFEPSVLANCLKLTNLASKKFAVKSPHGLS